VLLLAKSPAAASQLAQAFRHKAARKLYWAILVGKPPHPFGTVDMPVRRQMGSAGERVVVLDDLDADADLDEIGARRAITDFAIVDRAADRFSFVALEPRTGRTHQLRVHMAAIGAPILGDGKYGGPAAHPRMAGIARQVHLHARRLAIPVPGGATLDVTAPPPKHFKETLAALEFETQGADRFVDEISREHERRIA
jgi:23S rRNA pseudouridine955/2504/2580 synthase